MKTKSIKSQKKFYLFIIYLFILLPTNVIALKGDDTSPIEIFADHLTLEQKIMRSEFLGHVIITRGSIIIHANKGLSNEKNNIKTLTLFGTPITFSQLEDDQHLILGQCDEFNYDTKTNIAILTGNAKIKKNQDSIEASEITYNTKTHTYKASGRKLNGFNNKSTGRVKIILDKLQNDKTN